MGIGNFGSILVSLACTQYHCGAFMEAEQIVESEQLKVEYCFRKTVMFVE